ncbi:MAG: FlgO family outer membrane protein [Nitrospirota bacterium]
MIRKSFLFVLLLGVMSWCMIPSLALGKTPEAYNQAKKFYEAGDYTTTAYKCVEALKVAKGHRESIKLLEDAAIKAYAKHMENASMYEKQNKWELAIGEYSELEKISSSISSVGLNPEDYFPLAMVLKKKELTIKSIPKQEVKPQVIKTFDERIDELVQQISSAMIEKKKVTIAVVEFTDLNGNVNEFSRYLAEELITRLFQTGKFKVIERRQLNKVIEEQKLSLTGMIDPDSAKTLGKILGVEAIVTGSMADLQDSVKLNARIIGTENADVLSVASTMLIKDAKIKEMMGKMVLSKVVATIPVVTPTPVVASTPVVAPTPIVTPTPQLKSTTVAENYQSGLKGEYFNMVSRDDNIWPEYPVLTRIDKILNFDWKDGSPAPRVNSAWFMARWTGEIFAPASGMYTFKIIHDDGVRVKIDSKIVLNIWNNTDRWETRDSRFDYNLGQGWHLIKLEFIEYERNSCMQFFWSKPGETEFEIVPTENFRTLK